MIAAMGSTGQGGESRQHPATSTGDLVRLLPGILWEADVVDWRNLYVSDDLREIAGYEPEDWLRVREFWEDRVHPDDRAGVIRIVDQGVQRGESEPYEYRWRVADGSYRRFRDRLRVIHNADGSRHLAGMMVDVTDEANARDHTLAALAERDRLAASLEQTAEMLMVSDPVGVISYVNSAFERTMGVSRDAVVGRLFSELGEIVPRSMDRDEAATLQTGQPWSGEMRARTRTGRSLRLLSSVVPVRDASGAVTMMMGVHHDVTKVRELDAQRAQAAKLEAIGQLAGGVAHDFNNILTVIMGSVRFIADGLPPDSPIHNDLDQITIASERARRLTSQLVAFGRRSTMQPEVVEVGDLVLRMGPALGAIVGQGVALDLRCDEAEPALALVDPGQLRRAVTNLVRNARRATADGGSIVVETSVRAGDGERGADPGVRWVVVRVTDTGSGIAPEVLPRIFDPFFTTDEFGQGSGLGLPVVDGFARQSLGHVRVASQVGEGSTFEVWLPEHATAAEVASEVLEPGVSPEAGGGARGLTVMVVEDEAVVRAVARRVLVAAGHRVLLASSGQEALAVAARFEGEIDVLLSDVVMPGIRGPELAEELRKVRPAVRVVLASGYAEDDITRLGIAREAAAFLAKPYAMDVLLAAVEGREPAEA